MSPSSPRSEGTMREPDRQALFRPEAIIAAMPSSMGRPVAQLPISWSLLSGVLVVVAIGGVGLLAVGNYTRSERVNGIVNTVESLVRVSTPIGGNVDAIFVREGQHVRKGDPLARISTERFGSDGSSADAQTIAIIDQELESLADRLRMLKPAATLLKQGTNAKISSLIGTRSAERSAEIAARERLSLAKESLERMQPVASRGFISTETIRRHREEVITLRDAQWEAKARQIALEGQIKELQAERDTIPLNLVQQQGELISQIGNLKKERRSAIMQRGFLLKATAAGEVTALQVHEGQDVDQRTSLLNIAPPKGTITAELYIPSRSIGFVKIGQQVRIRYDSFPYQHFGVGFGHITHVSLGILKPEDVTAAVQVKEPVYRATATIDQNWLEAYGRHYRLRSGMLIDADITLERRSFGEWLLEPILALRGRL